MSNLTSPLDRRILTLNGTPAVPGGPLRHYLSVESFERTLLQFAQIVRQINVLNRQIGLVHLDTYSALQTQIHDGFVESLVTIYGANDTPVVDPMENQLYIYRHLRYVFSDLTAVEAEVTPVIIDIDAETYQLLQRQPPVDQFKLHKLIPEQASFYYTSSDDYYLEIIPP
jgi:hypothetical protein